MDAVLKIDTAQLETVLKEMHTVQQNMMMDQASIRNHLDNLYTVMQDLKAMRKLSDWMEAIKILSKEVRALRKELENAKNEKAGS
jgi:glutaredoxin 2